ncbi:MAG TPA: hypothetical protein EYP04_02155, partial [Anaerolineae bacterium]|nr:hypothetical protein [Anaerolineae bacterium]
MLRQARSELTLGVLIFLLPLLALPWAWQTANTVWRPTSLRGVSVRALTAASSEGLTILYAETAAGGLWRSIDGGDTWARIDTSLPRGKWGSPSVVAVAATPNEGRQVYISLAGSGVDIYRSDDSGTHWRLSKGGLAPGEGKPLAVSAADPMTVYAGAGSRLFWSPDGGHLWLESEPWPGQGMVTALAVSPDDPRTVYVGTDTGILFRSHDAGHVWEPLSLVYPDNLPAAVNAIAISSLRSRQLYVATGHGLLRSSDGGESWQVLGQDLPARRSVSAIALDPLVQELLYVSVARAGVYRSQDGGDSWEPLRAGLGRCTVSFLILDPGDRLALYVGFDDGVWRMPLHSPQPTRYSSLVTCYSLVTVQTGEVRRGGA